MSKPSGLWHCVALRACTNAVQYMALPCYTLLHHYIRVTVLYNPWIYHRHFLLSREDVSAEAYQLFIKLHWPAVSSSSQYHDEWSNGSLMMNLPNFRFHSTIYLEEVRKGKGKSCPCAHFIEYDASALDGGEWSASRPSCLTPGGESPHYPLDRKLRAHRNWSGCCGIQKNILPLPGIELRLSSPSPSLYWLTFKDTQHPD
jgi:hypothetical protein